MSARRLVGAGQYRRDGRKLRARVGGLTYLLDYSDFTITRSGEAAFWDPRDGAFAGATEAANWIATDTARVFSDDAILIEGTRTNEITEAADFSAWDEAGTCTVTTDDETAPDQSSKADELAFGATSTDGRSLDITTLTSSVTAYASVWAKVATGTEDFRLQFTDKDGATTTATKTATTSWQRFEMAISDTGSGVTTPSLALINESGGGAKSVHFWGAQVEESASFASANIRTTGAAATRAEDDATLTIDASLAALLEDPGGYSFYFWPEHDSTDTRDEANQRLFSVGNNVVSCFFAGTTGRNLRLFDGSLVCSLTAPTWTAGDKLTVHCKTPPGGAWELTIENITTASGEVTDTGTGDADTFETEVFAIGSHNAGASGHFFGVFSRLWKGDADA